MSWSNPFAPEAVPHSTECKCCGGTSGLLAVMDAARGGVDVRAGRSVKELSGRAIYYYRCQGCGFTFTRAFDHWTQEDFAQHIYNADYARHDPEYLDGERGKRTARDVISQFGAYAGDISVLDWGCGDGAFAETLRQHGFSRVDGYDPFVAGLAERPSGTYDMVTCFEVIEHVVAPVRLVEDLAACRSAQGVILISTLCCSQQVADYGLEHWYYCVPRNGHISLMTPRALMHCAREVGLVSYSFTEAAHVMFDPDAIPVWLQSFLPEIGLGEFVKEVSKQVG